MLKLKYGVLSIVLAVFALFAFPASADTVPEITTINYTVASADATFASIGAGSSDAAIAHAIGGDDLTELDIKTEQTLSIEIAKSGAGVFNTIGLACYRCTEARPSRLFEIGW
jgi:hypothetical protein